MQEKMSSWLFPIGATITDIFHFKDLGFDSDKTIEFGVKIKLIKM